VNIDGLLRSGRLPWSPNPASRDLKVWDEYEHPRSGTFAIGSETVLFTMVGRWDRISVWAYTYLTTGEAAELSGIEFDSLHDLQGWVSSYFGDRLVSFALADDLLIQRWSVPDGRGRLEELAVRFLENLVSTASSHRDSGTMLRAKLAEYEVATADLVGA
jgi:hypothetical protein